MIKITDKEFRYTPSFATDLKKRFKKAELGRKRADADRNKLAEATKQNSIIPIAGRQFGSKT
jgi:hypothetical protein